MLPLELTAPASATDVTIQKKFFGSETTALIISYEEMKDITKIVESQESCLLTIGIRETIKNEAKEQKGGFLDMLLGTLAASALGNMLAGKPKIPRQIVARAGARVVWAGEGQNF